MDKVLSARVDESVIKKLVTVYRFRVYRKSEPLIHEF
jgi:hypothetical protein